MMCSETSLKRTPVEEPDPTVRIAEVLVLIYTTTGRDLYEFWPPQDQVITKFP